MKQDDRLCIVAGRRLAVVQGATSGRLAGDVVDRAMAICAFGLSGIDGCGGRIGAAFPCVRLAWPLSPFNRRLQNILLLLHIIRLEINETANDSGLGIELQC
jgi:hypothetical protein